MTGGSPKASSGCTRRLYNVYYILDGIEVKHSNWAIGDNKGDAQVYWETKYNLKASKLKIK